MILAFTILFFSYSPILCMQSMGMQELELAKHRAEFQAGMKKLLERVPEDPDPSGHQYTPVKYEQEMRKNRETRKIAQELEAAFNSLSASREESQTIVAQKGEKLSGLKKLWELANHNYVSDFAATGLSAIDIAFYSEEARKKALSFKEMAEELEAAFAQKNELIAKLQAQSPVQDSRQQLEEMQQKLGQLQLQLSQRPTRQEHQSLLDTFAQVRASLQEKTNALFDLAAANYAQESTIASLQMQLQDKEQEIAMLKEKSVKQ